MPFKDLNISSVEHVWIEYLVAESHKYTKRKGETGSHGWEKELTANNGMKGMGKGINGEKGHERDFM
jgi:hypothetical protein